MDRAVEPAIELAVEPAATDIHVTDDHRCTCEPDLDDVHFARQCDYCGMTWAGRWCVHAAYQEPCPECDVSPVPQLA